MTKQTASEGKSAWSKTGGPVAAKLGQHIDFQADRLARSKDFLGRPTCQNDRSAQSSYLRRSPFPRMCSSRVCSPWVLLGCLNSGVLDRFRKIPSNATKRIQAHGFSGPGPREGSFESKGKGDKGKQLGTSPLGTPSIPAGCVPSSKLEPFLRGRCLIIPTERLRPCRELKVSG
jgi:hypothetical protein